MLLPRPDYGKYTSSITHVRDSHSVQRSPSLIFYHGAKPGQIVRVVNMMNHVRGYCRN